VRDTYSLYEAKARFSAIVRRVREGHHVVVTVHGEPVAEIRPLEAPGRGIDARIQELRRRGALAEPKDADARIRPGRHVPGALRRFLADRNK